MAQLTMLTQLVAGNKLNGFSNEDVKALSEPLTMTTINIYTQVIDGFSALQRRLTDSPARTQLICPTRISADAREVPLPLQLAGHCQNFPRDIPGRHQGR